MFRGGLFKNAGGIARQLLAVGAVLLAFQTTTADANPRTCKQIEASLAAQPSGNGSATATSRYDDAIARQQQQMQKAREQARQAGCGREISGAAIAFCASVNASMDKMQRNLADLQGKRTKLGGRDTRRERARLQAAFKANGCGNARQPRAEQVAIQPGRAAEQPATAGDLPARIGTVRGNFRTMCVRSCDGYYFPVSNSVPQSGFARDQQACEAMCPGTSVELYFHRMPGQEADEMISVSSGQPYKQTRTAFLYRKQNAAIAPSCGCNAAVTTQGRGFQVIGGDYGTHSQPENDAAVQAASIPQPSARPDPADDPETLASREGGLDADALKRLATRVPAATAVDAGVERPVRVVGPTFLPDPEAAIDLQAPAPALVR